MFYKYIMNNLFLKYIKVLYQILNPKKLFEMTYVLMTKTLKYVTKKMKHEHYTFL